LVLPAHKLEDIILSRGCFGGPFLFVDIARYIVVACC